MMALRLDLTSRNGGTLRLTTGARAVRVPLRQPRRPAANDDGIPIDARTHEIASGLIDDFGEQAHGIANRRAMEAFWAGDMATCKTWTRAGRLVDAHFAASAPQRVNPPLRDLIATLATSA